MNKPHISSWLRRVKAMIKGDPDGFLGQVSGVIHIGANTGQERDLYARYGLRVLWIEPIPEVFTALEANLAGYVGQRALKYLVTDKEGAEYPFNVASNFGASSSILDLKRHKEIWPEVGFTRQIVLTSTTLAALLAREKIDPAGYDALIMDTQGSELLVLQGAQPVLKNFRFIKTEVPDFEAYAGCCQLADIEAFLSARGFREYRRNRFAERAGVGSYYDITYCAGTGVPDRAL